MPLNPRVFAAGLLLALLALGAACSDDDEPNEVRDDESAAASGRLVTGECDAGLVRGLGLTRIMAGAWAA